MNADLQQFVRECLARGIAREQVREQLAQAGWRAEEIDTALAGWADAAFPVPVPRRRPYLSARETFLYLVMFVTLYVTAFNVGALGFWLVDRWLPDPVMGRGYDVNTQSLRNVLAALLIAFPAFVAMARFIGRQRTRDPERRDSAVRKWLTYLTLFVAALVILGDLTVLVQRLLAGELPPRFTTKFLIVLAIAGYVFGHYLASLHREEDARERPAPGPTWRARIAGGGVVAIVLLGFWAGETPQQARRQEADRQRISDLQEIAAAVDRYYAAKSVLPVSIDQLAGFSGSFLTAVRDPQTQRPYEYRAMDSASYELCATFDAAATSTDPNGDDTGSRTPIFWRHPAGHYCYTLVPDGAARARPAPPR